MTNGQPKHSNDASTSSASTSKEKKEQRNKRYYESHKENTKVSKLGPGDVTQRDLLGYYNLERIPFRTLQINGSHSTSTNTHIPKRQKNDVTTSSTTPPNTLPSITDEMMMPERSRGLYIFFLIKTSFFKVETFSHFVT